MKTRKSKTWIVSHEIQFEIEYQRSTRQEAKQLADRMRRCGRYKKVRMRSAVLGCVLAAFCLLTVGCSHNQSPLTIAPHSVTSTGPSFDQNERDSGLLYCDANGCVVTPHFIDRHKLSPSTPGVKAEGANYRITAEVVAACIELDRVRKKAQK